MSGHQDGRDGGDGPGGIEAGLLAEASSSRGRVLGAVEGTNVVRVAFGMRRARRARPERPDHWATLVIPFQQAGGDPTPPPQAA
ncbi:hypothetical protein [Cyanobium sp. PCC 7001]|uniref:hypothetical protein n=1 Tax=Cyanobium sp. PCC 7001 TaxID=180281 RepID=UPI001CED59D0|nr:hypothetical protein [Cyanobium sp. PCC 7001]